MSGQSARDPFLGLNNHIRKLAGGEVPAFCVLGRVLSASPLRIRAEGIDLDADDLRVAWHLTRGYLGQLGDALDDESSLSAFDALRADDTVLLIPSLDRQVYYIVDKFVEVLP